MANDKNYRTFSENDFIGDPFFQDWVINRNNENESFWSAFFEAHPEKKEAAETARAFLTRITFTEDVPGKEMIQRSFANHLEEIRQYQERGPTNIGKQLQWRKLLKVAAIFAGLVITLLVLFRVGQKEEVFIVRSNFGEIRPVLLPDSSRVVLNANSSIRLRKSWDAGETREVWLEGEAFFDVRHLRNENHAGRALRPFIVHTGELKVSVLGTEFDIRRRRGKTEIVLQAGRIMVSFNDNTTKDVIMYPGDLLGYNINKKALTTARTSAEDFSAWQEKKLVLNDPTAMEIVEYLEDYFGKEIVLENPGLGERIIQGPILLTNLDDALFILSTILNAEIKNKGNTITLKSR